MEKKSNNKLIIILLVVFLGLPFVVGCVGILAAIAIPSFLRYTQKSKAVEAQANIRMLGSVAEMSFIETCKFPEPLPQTFVPDSPECCGGNKCLPAELAGSWKLNAGALNHPNYFAYSAEPGPANTYIIRAVADFQCGGPMHTVELQITGQQGDGTCTALTDSPMVMNELE